MSCSDFQEFSPEGFYNQLEEEERELERIPDKTDITNYVKLKLGLVQSEEPRPNSPEDPEPESQSVYKAFVFYLILILFLRSFYCLLPWSVSCSLVPR